MDFQQDKISKNRFTPIFFRRQDFILSITPGLSHRFSHVFRAKHKLNTRNPNQFHNPAFFKVPINSINPLSTQTRRSARIHRQTTTPRHRTFAKTQFPRHAHYWRSENPRKPHRRRLYVRSLVPLHVSAKLFG